MHASKGIHPGFEIKGRHYLKSKTGPTNKVKYTYVFFVPINPLVRLENWRSQTTKGNQFLNQTKWDLKISL